MTESDFCEWERVTCDPASCRMIHLSFHSLSHAEALICPSTLSITPFSLQHDSSSSSSSSSLENTQMELVENSGERTGGMENSASELRNRAEEQHQLEVEDGARVSQIESLVAEVVSIRPRRSVSLDSSSVANINLALASVLSPDSDSDSNRVLGDVNGQIVSKRVTGNENLSTTSKGRSSSFRIRYLHSVPSSMKRSRSYNGKHLLSWYSRSQTQKKPNAPLRSF